MTGDEFDQTAREVTEHILPLMRQHGIRYVQVARHGPKEADGITILSDTRLPDFLYIKGDFKLSDELSASGQTYRAETLMTMTGRAGNVKALELFQGMLDADEWTIYRVRRLYGAKAGTPSEEPAKKGTVQRAVENGDIFPSELVAHAELHRRAQAAGWDLNVENDIHYAYVQRRGAGYPAREEYFVVAPARVEDKTRYGIEYFNRQWAPDQLSLILAAA